MPQMKPMNWMFLFMLTIFMLLFMNIINYFHKNNKKILKKNKLNMKNYYWNW